MVHYSEDDKARTTPAIGRVGEPLPQGPRPGLTQPLPDPLTHQPGQDHHPSDGGHRILQGMDPTTRSPLQRRWTRCSWRPSSSKLGRQGSGTAYYRPIGGTPRGANEAPARRRDVELA